MRKLNRREFLKRSSIALASLALPRASLPHDVLPSASALLGRITTWRYQAVRREPSSSADLVTWKVFDDLIAIYGSVVGEAPWPTNAIWYRTNGGYIHSAHVQPVRNMPSREVVTDVEEPGFWGQVCVPFAEARWRPDSLLVWRRLYYGTVYRVVGSVEDEWGDWWYLLKEGITYTPSFYVPARTVKLISAEKLTPFLAGKDETETAEEPSSSPHYRPYKLIEIDEELVNAPSDSVEKRIEVDIANQRLVCFQGGQPIFSTRISSGLPGSITPRGEFRVLLKRHAQRMVGPDYDLPGVSFPVYFTSSGVAIHGTYWHNDFGRPHSHGCVNVTNEAAQWVFRWTDPPVPYTSHTHRAVGNEGTRIIVF